MILYTEADTIAQVETLETFVTITDVAKKMIGHGDCEVRDVLLKQAVQAFVEKMLTTDNLISYETEYDIKKEVTRVRMQMRILKTKEKK